uniref:Uncharacterized protein n=1 Tax=Anopheles atroparvus TaxID=41427 RepID=A0AAG5D0X5_ANOAO
MFLENLRSSKRPIPPNIYVQTAPAVVIGCQTFVEIGSSFIDGGFLKVCGCGYKIIVFPARRKKCGTKWNDFDSLVLIND